MSTKEVQEALVANMKRWQEIEDASVSSTGKIIDQTENPVIKTVMEIIQRDSQMHHRVQGMIADSLEKQAISLTPEELATVWESIESHIALEQETIKLAREALKILEGKQMVVQEYLLNYLLADESKHNAILATLDKIKAGMYPYG